MLLPLHTRRLVLREHSMADLDAFHALFSDPAVVRYLYEQPLSRDEAAEHLTKRLSSTAPEQDGEWLNLAVVENEQIVGDAGIKLVSLEHRQWEVGYILAPARQGRGLATEAVAVLVDLAFGELKAHRVCGRLDARNEASARLLARLGMRREAHFRENEWVKGEWTDEIVYAITEDEWRDRKHSG